MPRLPITELDVQALVDSQLTWEEEKRVRKGIQDNPALGTYYRQIVAQKKLLLSWWRSRASKEEDETPLH